MKVIIAGSRTVTDMEQLTEAIRDFTEATGNRITEVIQGGARGVDALAKRWALMTGLTCHCYPADWNKHGKAAGPIRNRQMAEQGEALIALWDGKSRGTKNMIDEAAKLGRYVWIHHLTS